MRRFYALLLLPVLLLTAAFQAFEPLDEDFNIDGNIQFPPPIYTLRGEVTIYGTANLPTMTGFFLEFRALNPDYTIADESVPWLPITANRAERVLNGILGVWDTTLTEDGAYEIRMVITVSGGGREIFRVSPLRVENEPSPFAPVVQQPAVVPTAVAPVQQPTQPPTQVISTAPQVVANTNANVRAGDSTSYAVVGSLPQGQSAPILARSGTGSGWFLIRLPNGRQGWISPSTVTVQGDLSGVQFLNPPTLTPSPAPTATPAPSLPDAALTNIIFTSQPVQGSPFTVAATVFNNSSVPLPETQVLCSFRVAGNIVAQASAYVPPLNPFTQIVVSITTTISSGSGSSLTAECAVDVNNVIQELNENNNFFNLTTTLG
jgi:uncharacterized protein YgiM (DUF1202 family)